MVFLFFQDHSAEFVCTWETRSKYLSKHISVARFIFLGCFVCFLNVLRILFCRVCLITPLLIFPPCLLLGLLQYSRLLVLPKHAILTEFRALQLPHCSHFSHRCLLLCSRLVLLLIFVAIFFLFLLFKGKKRTHRT